MLLAVCASKTSKVRDNLALGHASLTASPDKELWFDFGPPKKLRKNEFKKHFDHLQLDSVLQYVAFPQIELIEEDDAPSVRHRTRTVGLNINTNFPNILTLLGFGILLRLAETTRSRAHC